MSNRPSGTGQGSARASRRNVRPPRHGSMPARGPSTHSPLARALMATNTNRSLLGQGAPTWGRKKKTSPQLNGTATISSTSTSSSHEPASTATGPSTADSGSAPLKPSAKQPEKPVQLTENNLRERSGKSLDSLDLSQLSSASPASRAGGNGQLSPRSPRSKTGTSTTTGGTSVLFPASNAKATGEFVRRGGLANRRSQSLGVLPSLPGTARAQVQESRGVIEPESTADTDGTNNAPHVDERDRDDVPYIRGSRLAEIAGFVLWVTSFSCGVMFFLWAYLPESTLHTLGITWYPRKYWAIAGPAWILGLIAYVAFMYVALNMMSCPNPDSMSYVTDAFAAAPSADEGLARSRHAVPPLHDIPLGLVSQMLYGQLSPDATSQPTPSPPS